MPDHDTPTFDRTRFDHAVPPQDAPHASILAPRHRTTTLGMVGQPPLRLALDRLPSRAVVCAIVYVPLETPLLAAASARGLKTVDGLGMLLHQAVPGFDRWFGQRPQVSSELRDMIVADLGGAA